MRWTPLSWLAISSCLVFGRMAVCGEIKGTVSSEWIECKKDILVFVELIDSSQHFQPPLKHPTMDQKDLAFIPHILPILVGTTVVFPNNDQVQHNVFSPSKTKNFNLGSYPPGDSMSIRFEKPGMVVLLCNVHPEMSAYIIVLANPYFALTDQNGNFSIPNVPAGEYRLRTWHNYLKTETREITVTAKGTIEIDFELTLGKPIDFFELNNIK